MDFTSAIGAMSALAQPTRLRVVAALGEAHPRALPVGEIAAIVETPPNTMSTHLAILSRAGLVSARRRGRMVEYGIDPGAIASLAGFLTKLTPTVG